MPLYDYRCKNGHVQEEQHKIAELDVKVIKCKECDEVMERFIGSVDYAFMTPESLGRRKAPEDFRNWLSMVKKAHDRPGQPCGIKDH